jgi:large subunit ribosomal protein L9
MELILKQDVQNLGFKDDVVTVKTDTVVTLIPQGFAQLATSAKKVLAET